MVLVATPDMVDDITAVLTKWSLNASVIGRVTDDGRVRVRDGEITEVDVPVEYFIDECPTYQVSSEQPAYLQETRSFDLDTIPDVGMSDVAETLVRLMTSPNLGTRRSVWEQYDHTILTNTVYGPGESDAAVIRQKGTNGGMAISMDCNSRYTYLDPYEGARHGVAEAARNVACAGARPLGLTNCLNFGSPERSPANYQLVKSVEGMGDAARALNVPIVSGNVSLYNETQQQPIFPTPMVACVGVLDDIETRMAMRWRDGDEILLVGGGEPSLGGSEYLAFVHHTVAGVPPVLDIDAEKRLIQFLQVLGAGVKGAAAHDISGGGLAVALTEMALVSGVGAAVRSVPDAGRRDATWFGESATRVLVAVQPKLANQVELFAQEWELPVTRIGVVGGTTLSFADSGSVELADLREASESALSVGVEAEMA